MVPLSRPDITEAEVAAVTEVLLSGWLTHGPKTKEFEQRVAEFVGVNHGVAMNSATSALFIALVAQDIRGEVILPSFTFVASANAIVTAGATPVFADVEPDTCNIDPDDIERRITPQTEAIMPVHFAGQPARMDRIMAVAERHGLAVIEDSAETLGGEWQGRRAGSFATGTFSFFPTKNITCGEGGMLTTNDDMLASRVRALIAHGITSTTAERERSSKPWYRSASLSGYNFRLSNVLGAIGAEQMKKLDRLNSMRREHAAYLNKRLSRLEQLILPTELAEAKHVYQMYTVRVRDVERDDFVRRLRDHGVGASVHFDPPVHLHEAYREAHGDAELPVTEQLCGSIVTLPMYPGLTGEELDTIVDAIAAVLAATTPADKQCA